MSSLATIVSAVRDYIKSDPSDKIWSLATKQRYVNIAYFHVQKDGNFKWPENEATTTMTLVGGTQEYALSTYASDFIRMDLVQFTDTAGAINATTKTQALWGSLSSTSRPSEYYLFNGKIGFYPSPNTSYSVRLLYRKKLPTMTASVDCAFPSDFDEAIALYAAYKLWSNTKNQAKAAQALDDYKMAIQELKTAYLFQDTAMLTFAYQRGGRRNKYDPKILN